ncbi:DUF6415 family natural product biosynthesis protein [Streptomyces cinnamoneus]
MRSLTGRLRAYVLEKAYDLELAAGALPPSHRGRCDALAAVHEARYRLGLGPGDGYASAITYARSLGRARRRAAALRAADAADAAGPPGAAGGSMRWLPWRLRRRRRPTRARRPAYTPAATRTPAPTAVAHTGGPPAMPLGHLPTPTRAAYAPAFAPCPGCVCEHRYR